LLLSYPTVVGVSFSWIQAGIDASNASSRALSGGCMVDRAVVDVWALKQSCCRRRLGNQMQWYLLEDGRWGAGVRAADELRSKRLPCSTVPLPGGLACDGHRPVILRHLGEGRRG
jgi:hypothetical protein